MRRARRPVLGSLLQGLLLLAIGCEDPEPLAVPEAPEAHEATTGAPPVEAVEVPSVVAEAAPATAPIEAPAEGCRLSETEDLGRAAWSDVVTFGDGFAVALLTSDADGESLQLYDVSSEPPRSMGQARLDLPAGARRGSGPALASVGRRLMAAYVDGGSRLRVVVLSGRPRLTPRTVAEGASLRFRPALAVADEGWAVAWTNAHDTPMRVFSRALRADGQPVGDEQDHTPLAGGAAAPTMVAGASPPRLLFLDPRQATSVCLGAAWSEGAFAAAEVARPVGLVTEPPEIAAVRLGADDWLAYTGIGNLATTAVGFVSLASADDPGLLVPGTGYGTLHVDGAPMMEGAVLVADAPLAAPPSSPRELHVRAVSPTGALGQTLTVAGPDAHADRGRIAARGDGRVAVTYRSAEHTWLADVRCAVPAETPEDAPVETPEEALDGPSSDAP
ncbi:MAG: hypothetical protein AB8I08_01730 [Sandaracinaceae bacterium]